MALFAADEKRLPPDDAMTLATRVDVDPHRAADLVARGCPPSLALRILL